MPKYTHLTTQERLSFCQGIREGRSLADIARTGKEGDSTSFPTPRQFPDGCEPKEIRDTVGEG